MTSSTFLELSVVHTIAATNHCNYRVERNDIIIIKRVRRPDSIRHIVC